MTEKHSMDMTRRGFLKLAGGAALGAALFTMPSLSMAKMTNEVKHRSLKAMALNGLPKDGVEAAKSSALVNAAYDDILKIVGTIKDTGLKNNVLSLIKNPTPTFMQEYTSQSSISSLYSKLASAGLIDTAKIDASHLLPPMNKKIQPFMTAPGSGYGSHHPYPGGLSTHVDSNLHITQGICKTYEDVFYYGVDYDTAIAAQALHDIAKPFVFQWQDDGSSLKEYTIAGQGAHHVISLAEVMYRGFPAEMIVAQACAHGAPSNAKEEAGVVSWLKAAAIMAHKNPVAIGVLNKSGEGLPDPHHQEGYIVHLGDHDWVLTSPAAQKTVNILRDIAKKEYDMNDSDANGAKFNYFRNYVGAQLGYMFLNCLSAQANGYSQIVKEVKKVVL